MMKMAAIYARVSSEQQREENTIASQTASLIEFAKSHHLEVPAEWVFEDEGYSGATLERPGLERVRDLAAEGQIQVVLAYSPDRLSRKYAYQILLIEEFARYGVETLFVKSPQGNSPEDQLLVQFQGMIAEYERAQILERSRRGKRHRAHTGEVSVMSGAPYGYRYIRKTEEALAAYMINEAEAGVVRRVYEMYTVEGLSIAEITRRLNREGIPPRRASRWERSVVWGMLRNPAYRGVACFGKTRLSARMQMRSQRRRGITTPSHTAGHQRPREEWIEIPVPALVTEESFARAEELLYHTRYDRVGVPSSPVWCRGSSVVRSVATPCREPRRKPAHGKFITTSALAPIAGGNWAAPFATIIASFARNCSIRSSGPRWSACSKTQL
jgi:site-specific DNA recombinase